MTEPAPAFSEEQLSDRLFQAMIHTLEAGFARCEVLPIDNPLFRFYRLS